MVDYNTQVNQIPTPYYPYGYGMGGSSKKRQLGMMVLGGLIGMTGYYMPVKKDVFVQRGFDMTRDGITEQIETLEKIAKEVAKNKVSTESKLFLQDIGVAESVSAISAKCTALKESVTNPASVETIKKKFIDSFDNCKKKTHLMDAQSSDAFRAVRRNKFKWGVGIGAGIGLAIGLITGRE